MTLDKTIADALRAASTATITTVLLKKGVRRCWMKGPMPAFKSSGDITSMSRADGYIEIPQHTDIVEKDELVEVRLF